jgi:hypothetical protein
VPAIYPIAYFAECGGLMSYYRHQREIIDSLPNTVYRSFTSRVSSLTQVA